MSSEASRLTTLIAQARTWLAEDPDPGTREELEGILKAEDWETLRERFGNRLEFGTAGLRGIIGAGPNCMNRALVRRVTAGLGRYLLEALPDVVTRGVVVGYDGRRLSPEFAEDTAAVLAGLGIPAHVFAREATTPLCAYAVTALGAAAGVMVTASHNPPAYNGYKVYWENGAQIIPPHDRGISAAIDAVGALSTVDLVDRAAASSRGLWKGIDPSVEDAYVQGVLGLRRHPDLSPDLGIVYTPMHGVGGAWVERAFREAGYTRLTMVPEQFEPDGEFPTVEFPNPEEPGAMDLALALARRVDADLILANDPDADRLAAIVRGENGEFRPLTGNEIGTLLAHYLLTEGPVDGERLVLTTLVSSGILRSMAGRLGVHYAETLTGFKWIANRAMELKAAHGWRFVFGFEEALGYTVDELVRDKDGVGAALVFAEMAAVEMQSGGSVRGRLERIYREYGFHASRQKSLTLPGSEGLARIRAMMSSLRETPPLEIAGSAVTHISDVQEGSRREVSTGAETPLGYPASNVLRYELADGSRILARPSGTEPKIKFYAEVAEPFPAELGFAEAEARAGARVERLVTAFAEEAESRV